MILVDFFKNYPKILGLNARNLEYVLKKSQAKKTTLANNKLRVKKILKEANLPVSDIYAVIKNIYDFDKFNWELPKTFVLKPNKGLGGQGVVIVYGKKKNSPVWIKAGQQLLPLSAIKNHVNNILEGNFSSKEREDTAFFEERIFLHPDFKPYTFKGGIPDIRVVVYDKIPVMAELRLPTEESEGRSNLHLGGIGVGIDMKTGITTTAIQHNRPIEYIPKTRLVLSGLQIPQWKEILRTAALAQKVIGIKLLGIDIALDRKKGPVIFEVNSRPGLAIQLANQAPLRERLERIKDLKIKSAQRGTKIARELFGEEVEEELKELQRRRVIGIFEVIDLLISNNQYKKVKAKIDTGAYRTSIDERLVKELDLEIIKKSIQYISSLGKETRQLANLKFLLGGTLIETQASIADRSQLKYDMIIGRRDLRNFLIDPLRRSTTTISVGKKNA
jgi:alpha-L-glutamate ligase-like protein